MVLILSGTFTFAQQMNQPKFTPPPTNESAETKLLIDKAQSLLETKRATTTDLLTDQTYMALHEYPRFRELVKKYAVTGKTAIVTENEVGEALIISGTIKDKSGKPADGAVIYFYQTSALGWYSDKAYHISGMEGDHRHARLFGYLRTGKNGHYEFRTIKPSGYPGSELPAHIHLFVEAGTGAETHTLGSEIQFEDDLRLTPTMRERSRQEGALIRPAKRDANGVLRVEADFTLQR